MSQNVTADAQMGMFQVVRPFLGFEAVYQGQSGNIPIAIPGTLDPDAGKTGVLANLLGGITMPLGARVLMQIPMVGYSDTEDLVTLSDAYEYQLVWRTRNQQSYQSALEAGRQVAAYHLPSEAGRSLLSFIPGASDVEIFEQSEAVTGASLLNVVQQRYRPKVNPSWVAPLLPANLGGGVNKGAWQQGVYRSTPTSADGVGPTWVPLWLDSCGDELLILVYKVNKDQAWNFTSAGADWGFSNTYGSDNGQAPNNPNIGIILSSGTMGG